MMLGYTKLTWRMAVTAASLKALVDDLVVPLITLMVVTVVRGERSEYRKV